MLAYGGRVASYIMSGTDVPSLVDKKLVARRLQVGDLVGDLGCLICSTNGRNNLIHCYLPRLVRHTQSLDVLE